MVGTTAGGIKARQTNFDKYGKVWNGKVYSDGRRDEEPIYLCPKHANKLRKLLCIKFWGGLNANS